MVGIKVGVGFTLNDDLKSLVLQPPSQALCYLRTVYCIGGDTVCLSLRELVCSLYMIDSVGV